MVVRHSELLITDRLFNGRTDICDSRVDFTTENGSENVTTDFIGQYYKVGTLMGKDIFNDDLKLHF